MGLRSQSVLWTLSRVDWDFFAGLSFKGRAAFNPLTRQSLWRAFERRICGTVGYDAGQPVWFLRGEPGELNGRPHFHFLLAGRPAPRNLWTRSYMLRAQWCRLTGSFASVRPYDRAQAGVEYVAKCLGYSRLLANTYELKKFEGAESVDFSRSLVHLVNSLERMSEKHAVCDYAKTGRGERPGGLTIPESGVERGVMGRRSNLTALPEAQTQPLPTVRLRA